MKQQHSSPGLAPETPAIVKPAIDDQDYRFVCLNNGLKALLIHDATADKAAAACDVRGPALLPSYELPRSGAAPRGQETAGPTIQGPQCRAVRCPCLPTVGRNVRGPLCCRRPWRRAIGQGRRVCPGWSAIMAAVPTAHSCLCFCIMYFSAHTIPDPQHPLSDILCIKMQCDSSCCFLCCGGGAHVV